MTTKAAQIRILYAEGKTCKEIAALIPCRVEYVRVCAQQRGTKAVRSCLSKAERTYLLKRYKTDNMTEAVRLRARERYADPSKYARHLAAVRAFRQRRRSGVIDAAMESWLTKG